MSAIPYLQRNLNSHFAKHEEEKKLARKEKDLAYYLFIVYIREFL